MRVRRLGWAGLEVESGGSTLVIDFVTGAEPVRSALPEGALLPARAGALAALCTHLHSDHADPAAIEEVLADGGVVLRPREVDSAWTVQAEMYFAARSLTVRVMRDWECVTVGPFDITAVPSVDGLGDPQVNWVVAAGGKRVFHGGDTVFHGYWWEIAERCGPLDAAFLPINGAAVNFPHRQPASPLPAVLTPGQAVVAGMILGARQVVPIHYGIEGQPAYVEVDDPIGNLHMAAKRYGVDVLVVEPGVPVQLG
ncbi:MBL fold metallo-hydrolase [Kibdelosporangium philippinense]|uniref:MBL fold metallo-hydrolase n=1 Tax=Kibdelosporangium philippinense TaxID=211113 RepID=A0ABS8ZP91_9PSEU|nr:MBL fold metallo-hydrolase [Kibdelosporangium philippinense]MCE7009571.1 MBL fold metallo-hydrolase [Kibdelosporangium philippinense]